MRRKKPFIKIFETPNSYYCLDVNQNEILELNRDSFQYLQQLLRDQLPIDGIPTEVKEWMDIGYLATESNVKRVRHALTEYVSNYLDRRLLKLTLQVTQNCNFRCRYCVYSEDLNKGQRTHSLKNMSFETAKKAVDFLWKHSVDSSCVNIGFYGGEPLLQMDLIRQIISYSEMIFEGKKLGFGITTNGTLLNEEFIHYFEDHDVALMISLDGTKEINDRNRIFQDGRGTYDTVINKIELVRKVAPEYAKKMQISMVMDPENDFDCINDIYIQEKDFDDLFVNASIVDKDYDRKMPEASEEYIWKYRYQHFLGVLSYIGRLDKSNVSPIIYRAILIDMERRFSMETYAKLFETDAPGGPCLPGQLRLFCNVDGKLFPCERVSETSVISCIGSLDQGFDFEKVKNFLNVGQVTEMECKYCWNFRYCNLCGKKADGGHGKMEPEIKLRHCAESQNDTNIKFREKLLLKEIPIYYNKQILPLKEDK